jgi:hypothetical protein
MSSQNTSVKLNTETSVQNSDYVHYKGWKQSQHENIIQTIQGEVIPSLSTNNLQYIETETNILKTTQQELLNTCAQTCNSLDNCGGFELKTVYGSNRQPTCNLYNTSLRTNKPGFISGTNTDPDEKISTFVKCNTSDCKSKKCVGPHLDNYFQCKDGNECEGDLRVFSHVSENVSKGTFSRYGTGRHPTQN